MTVPSDGTLPQTTGSYRLNSLLSPGSAAQEARGGQSQRDRRLGPPAQDPEVPLPAGQSRAALQRGEGREVRGVGDRATPRLRMHFWGGAGLGLRAEWTESVNSFLSLAAQLWSHELGSLSSKEQRWGRGPGIRPWAHVPPPSASYAEIQGSLVEAC